MTFCSMQANSDGRRE